MTAYLGEIAGLLTALCWSLSSIFFTLASRSVGSVVINRLRLLMSLVLLGLTHWVVLASPLPVGAEGYRWFWLGLSGIVGLSLGDTFLFQAYIFIGPRLAILLKSLAPVFSALLAWVFLAERLSPWQMGGIGLTVAGVGWVVLERREGAARAGGELRRYGWGILFGLVAAATQAAGLIMAKKGLTGGFPALSGHVMRMLVGTAAIWAVAAGQRQVQTTLRQVAGRPLAARDLALGSVLGPFIGVWFSLAAVQLTQVGVASTLMGLVPIFMLPIGYFVFKERFGWQAVAGTVVAVAGVAMLF